MEISPPPTRITKGEPCSTNGILAASIKNAHEVPMNENPMRKDVLQRQANVAKVHETPTHIPGQAQLVQNVLKKMRWWDIVGCRGLLVLALILAVAVLHTLVVYISSKKFTYVNRNGIWIFIFSAIAYGFLFLHLVFRWKNQTITWVEKNFGDKIHKRKKIHAFSQARFWYKDYFGIERGKFYFWRMYTMEFIENGVQLYNIITVYLCMLPLGWSILFSCILICESLCRANIIGKKIWYSKTQNITVPEKDFQFGLDICIDFFFLVTPIAVTYFVYDLWPSVQEITWMLMFPTISLFSKLRRMMQESMHQYAESMLNKELARVSISKSRQRKSIFGSTFSEKIAKLQNKSFPYRAKILVLVLSICFATLVIVLVVVQAVSVIFFTNDLNCHTFISESDASKKHWDEGCDVKVLFCKNMFVPKCDCAVLNIKNHNITKLADRFVELTALRGVFINNGPLKALPKNMEKITSMNRFILMFNHLEDFQVDILKWTRLNDLDLSFNNISEYHENLWLHPQLVNLFVNNNPSFRTPKKVFLPQLTLLEMSNNSIPIPELNLPAITDLYLNGNIMPQLPNNFELWKNTLLYLGVARCGLKSLDNIDVLTKLMYLDARNNSLASVSNEVKSLITSKKGFESYFSGNPVCNSDLELNCQPLCTDYCWTHSGFKNGVCDHQCDSEACDFDGGDCTYA
eukprot:g1060.t1